MCSPIILMQQTGGGRLIYSQHLFNIGLRLYTYFGLITLNIWGLEDSFGGAGSHYVAGLRVVTFLPPPHTSKDC